MALFSSGIGIDVSDHHVRIAQVSHGGAPRGLFELVLPRGLIRDDAVVKPKGLTKELRNLINKAGLNELTAPTVLLVPESRVFTTSFMLPRNMKNEEKEAEARNRAQRDIPVPFNEAYLDVALGVRRGDEERISVCAIQKTVFDYLVDAFSIDQFPILAVESNNSALYRLYENFAPEELFLGKNGDLVMFIDVGHRWTNISLYDKMGTRVFARSIVLRKLSDTSRGVVKKLKKNSILKILQVVEETVRHFSRIENQVKYIFFAGVEGEQEGIVQACAKKIKKSKALRFGEIIEVEGITGSDIHTYGAAIGAALRATHPRRYSNNHSFIQD